MSGFHLEVRAFDVLDQIHVQIISRELGSSLEESMSPISVVQTTVQAPDLPNRREWLQDALIAALEAL